MFKWINFLQLIDPYPKVNHSFVPLLEVFFVFVPIDSITLFVWIHGQSLGILLFLFLVLIQSRSYAVNDP